MFKTNIAAVATGIFAVFFLTGMGAATKKTVITPEKKKYEHHSKIADTVPVGVYVTNKKDIIQYDTPLQVSGELNLVLNGGQQPTSGYQIKLDSISRSGDTVTIVASFHEPDGMTLQVITNPAYYLTLNLKPGRYNIVLQWNHPADKQVAHQTVRVNK